jgi:hypothetical protein
MSSPFKYYEYLISYNGSYYDRKMVYIFSTTKKKSLKKLKLLVENFSDIKSFDGYKLTEVLTQKEIIANKDERFIYG